MLSFVSEFEVMARCKQYNEEEVIEKAMNLFWQNGYETTSIRMLEKEMGINQFSIYASFGSKHGVFVESIKLYRKQLNSIRNTLKESENGVEGIKEFFYNFLKFTKYKDAHKGCLVCNTMSEMGEKAEQDLMAEMKKFTQDLRVLFVKNLSQDAGKSKETVEREANFLMTAMLGLSVGSRFLDREQIDDYLETAFINL